MRRSHSLPSAEPFAPAKRLRHLHAGFTLVETMFAVAISVMGLAGFFAASGQALRIVKSGKELGSASELLQQRVEAFRAAGVSHWSSKLLSPAGAASVVTSAQGAASTFPVVTESYVITPFPATGASFTVLRTGTAAPGTSGSALPAGAKCVRITGQVTWSSSNNRSRSRSLSTILTKGGL